MNLFKKDRPEFYNNIEGLRNANYPHPYTQEELDEIEKCRNDVIYFIEKYVQIVTVDGVKPFTLYNFQKRFIDSFQKNRFTIGKIFRQGGKTSVTVGYLLWYTIFSDIPRRCAILANNMEQAQEILSRYKFSYENLPFFLQCGIVKWNERSVWLDNGSKITAHATTKSGVRGKSINLILIDEAAFIPANIAQPMMASLMPTISSGKDTKIIAISTPCGMNHFYKMWQDAIHKKNDFFPIEAHWSEIRTQEWANEQLKTLNNDKVKFAQEIECAFLGSSYTLVDSSYISVMTATTPIHHDEFIKIYANPEPNRQYITVCDPSEGKDQDSSTFVVYDCTKYPFTIAAIYRNNKISPKVLPTFIENMSKKYNDAFVIIENNNSPEVGYILKYDLNYDNVYHADTNTLDVGIRTTKKTKKIGCDSFKDMVENGKIIINDEDYIEEVKTFVKNKMSYAAEKGYHDDIIMTGVILGWFASTDEFTQINETNLRSEIRNNQEQAVGEALTPIGFYSNGQDDLDDRYGLTDDQKSLLDWDIIGSDGSRKNYN